MRSEGLPAGPISRFAPVVDTIPPIGAIPSSRIIAALFCRFSSSTPRHHADTITPIEAILTTPTTGASFARSGCRAAVSVGSFARSPGLAADMVGSFVAFKSTQLASDACHSGSLGFVRYTFRSPALLKNSPSCP
jgi:hypothetical protein